MRLTFFEQMMGYVEGARNALTGGGGSVGWIQFDSNLARGLLLTGIAMAFFFYWLIRAWQESPKVFHKEGI